MSARPDLVGGLDVSQLPRKSRWPAYMDLTQSLTGLVLALFMWVHMFFVASILVSKDFMWMVTKFFEGYFIFGKAYPGIVSVLVLVISALLVLHAFLAMRKFPANYRQYRAFVHHRRGMAHGDTTLWWVQVVTGFMLFFLASVHLYQMLMNPDLIGPYASADRVWSGRWWPLYLVLLFAVEVHGGVGLYRLAIKWGWFEGVDPAASRRRLQRVKWGLTAFLLVLGIATLAAYMKIGYEHRDHVGERYVPTWMAPADSGDRP